MKLLIINGPNLNMLGVREPDVYGKETYADLCKKINDHAKERSCSAAIIQSNHEGDIVDAIQRAYGVYDGIVINPAAYTHTSVAILDALKSVSIPACEVHISDVTKREEFRQISYVSYYCEKSFVGYGTDGYIMAMDHLIDKYGKRIEL